MAGMDFVAATLALIPYYTGFSASTCITIVALVLVVFYLMSGHLPPVLLRARLLHSHVILCRTQVLERRPNHLNREQPMFRNRELNSTTDLSLPNKTFSNLYETREPGFLSGATLQSSPGGHGLAFPSWITPPLNFVISLGRFDYDIMNVKIAEDVVEIEDSNLVVVEDGIRFKWKVLKADLPNLQHFLEDMQKDAKLVIYNQIDHLRFDHAMTTLQAMKKKLWALFKDTPLALWIEVHLAHVLLRVALMNVDNAQALFEEALLTFNRCLCDMRYGDGWQYLNRLYCSAYLGRAWYYLIHGSLEEAKQDLRAVEKYKWKQHSNNHIFVTTQVHWAMTFIHLLTGNLKKASKSWLDIGYRVESTRASVNRAQRWPLDMQYEQSIGNLETCLSLTAKCILTEEPVVRNDTITEEASKCLQQICMGTIGDLWFALGACREAFKYYTMAVGERKKGMSKDFLLQAAGLVGRANVRMRLRKDKEKDYLGDAKKDYNESLSIYKRLGHTVGQSIVHCNLGTLLVAQATQVDQVQAQELLVQALYHYGQAKDLVKFRPATIVELDCKMGQVYLEMGKLNEAIFLLKNSRKSGQTRQALEPLKQAWIEHQLGHCLMKRSENETGIVKTNTLRSAEIHLINAIKSFAEVKLSTRCTERHFERLWFTMFEEHKETYALLQWCLACQKRPSDAVVWGERGRSRALMQDKWEGLKDVVEDIPQVNGDHDTWMENLHPENFDVLPCKDAWELLQRCTSLCELNGGTTIIQYIICKGFGLLIYVLDGSSKPSVYCKSFAELAIKSSIRNAEDIEQLVRETVKGFHPNDSMSTSDLNQKLIKLSDLLLLPIEEELSKNTSQLIIIPHEHLHRVPFPALYCREQTTWPYKKKPRQHLIMRYALSYVDSIRSLIRCSILYKRALCENKRLLDQDFTKIAALIVGIEDHQSANLCKLVGAELEAKEIKRICEKRWPEDVIQLELGLNATKKLVKEIFAKAHIVHFATHAYITSGPDSPEYEEGGIVFAKPPEAKFYGVSLQASLDLSLLEEPARSSSSDAYRGLHNLTMRSRELEELDGEIFLSADEISIMKLTARLVVLSACKTGHGVIAGEGVAGLGRALTRAGVPCTILSLWDVYDGATKELMVALYANLIDDKMSVATALQKAMVKMALEKSKKNPEASRWTVKHWAAFQTFGLSSVCMK